MPRFEQISTTLRQTHGHIRKCPATMLPKIQKLFRLGPLYSMGEDEDLTRIKDEAWQHVKVKTGRDLYETEETYMTEVGGMVERKARGAYADFDGNKPPSEVENMEGGDFKRCMIRHGCLFLLVVLAMLGAEAHHLKYADSQFIWGDNLTEDDLERKMKLFYKSMLFPGNQMPLSVLNKLMEQTFFKGVVAAKGRWDRPSGSDDLVLCTLFDLVLLPSLQNTNTTWWLRLPRAQASVREQATDILHGLHLQLVGGGARTDDVRFEDEWLDLEFGRDSNDIDANEEGRERVCSAMDLRRVGIRFKSSRGIGISGIYLRRFLCCAVLHLPVLTIDQATRVMLESLRDFENLQQLQERDVNAYLQFLSDIVRTLDDAVLLATQGVIRASPHQLNEVPRYLKKLANQNEAIEERLPLNSQKFRALTLHIARCSQRRWWCNKLLSVIGLLTLLSTIFTVLQYFK